MLTMYLSLLETEADRSTFEEVYELCRTPMYRAAGEYFIIIRFPASPPQSEPHL
jgi:hypothetical protein